MRLIAILFGALLTAATAQAATENFYLKMPGINGEALSKNFVGWIPVTSFSEGFMTSGAGAFGAGGRAGGRVSCQSLQVVKQLDSSSAEIAASVAAGRQFVEVDLAATTTSGDAGETTFLRFALHHAFVSSVTFGGDSTSSARVETITLVAESIEVTYWPQTADGRVGGPLTATITCR